MTEYRDRSMCPKCGGIMLSSFSTLNGPPCCTSCGFPLWDSEKVQEMRNPGFLYNIGYDEFEGSGRIQVTSSIKYTKQEILDIIAECVWSVYILDGELYDNIEEKEEEEDSGFNLDFDKKYGRQDIGQILYGEQFKIELVKRGFQLVEYEQEIIFNGGTNIKHFEKDEVNNPDNFDDHDFWTYYEGLEDEDSYLVRKFKEFFDRGENK